MESFRASLSRITPLHACCISSLPHDEVHVEHAVGTQVHEEAINPEDKDKDKDADASPLPEGVDTQGRDTIMSNISKKHFSPGGMAPSEWTRSVRAV